MRGVVAVVVAAALALTLAGCQGEVKGDEERPKDVKTWKLERNETDSGWLIPFEHAYVQMPRPENMAPLPRPTPEQEAAEHKEIAKNIQEAMDKGEMPPEALKSYLDTLEELRQEKLKRNAVPPAPGTMNKAGAPEGALVPSPPRISWTGQNCETKKINITDEMTDLESFTNPAVAESVVAVGYPLAWILKERTWVIGKDGLGREIWASNGGCNAADRAWVRSALSSVLKGAPGKNMRKLRMEQWTALDAAINDYEPKLFTCSYDCGNKGPAGLTATDLNWADFGDQPYRGLPGQKLYRITALNPTQLRGQDAREQIHTLTHELLHWTAYANARMAPSVAHDAYANDYLYAMARTVSGCPWRADPKPNNEPKLPMWPGGNTLQRDCIISAGTKQEMKQCGMRGTEEPDTVCAAGAGPFSCMQAPHGLDPIYGTPATDCVARQRWTCDGVKAEAPPPPAWPVGQPWSRVSICVKSCPSAFPLANPDCAKQFPGPEGITGPDGCKVLPEPCDKLPG